MAIAIGLGGCVLGPRPLKEFTLAHVAVNSARDIGATRLAPGFLYKAEQHYRKGIQYFKENARRKAQAHFIKARKYAERAENQARIKRFQSGDPLP